MWATLESMLNPDQNRTIPVRRGWAQKDPHVFIEEPEPYVYDHYPEPVYHDAGIYRPCNPEDILRNAQQSLQFHEDALRVTPYDLEHEGQRAISQQLKVDAFLRPPVKPMWQFESLDRIPAKIHHPEITVHDGSTTRGGHHVKPDRGDSQDLLVHERHYDTKVKPWDTSSKPGKKMDHVDYINPIQRGNLHDPLADQFQTEVQPHVHSSQNLGPSRFQMMLEPKLEDSFQVDPGRDPHLQLTGRRAEENKVLTEKAVQKSLPMRPDYKFQVHGRRMEENEVLTQKADSRERFQYHQPMTKVKICPKDVRESHYARYTPHLVPDMQVTSARPGLDQNLGTVIPNFHDRMTVDNQGHDGLDITGASMPAFVPLIEVPVRGLRRAQ